MTPPLSAAAVDLIKHFEGLRLEPYRDPVGVLTIGYGATKGLDDKRLTAEHPILTEEQAEGLLIRDTIYAAAAVDRMVKVPVNGAQRGALASFTYNLGAGALSRSTLLKRVNALEWGDVGYQFSRWIYAGGRVLPGLVRRRAAEAKLFNS